MTRHTQADLLQMQSLPLEAKVRMTQNRIEQWYDFFDGNVYVSFSGGKDSTVLKHIVDSMYDDVPSVFVNTGLEYPEVRQFALAQSNVVRVDPKAKFYEVIREHGYPVVGKRQARFIKDLQTASEANKATVNLRLTGINQKGVHCPTQVLPKRWRFLVDAPFKVSDKCCDKIKKEPLRRYQRETGRRPIIATMTHESALRKREWMRSGCNAFDKAEPSSQPMSFWTEQDVLAYISQNKLPIASVYGAVEQGGGGFLRLTGEQRTGCIFCAFGVHLEEQPNRFQRLRKSHPKQWRYCMDQLGMREVLTFMGIPTGDEEKEEEE